MNSSKMHTDSIILSNILNDNQISQTDFSKKYSVSKQLISFIVNGKRTIGQELRKRLKADFPSYFSDNVSAYNSHNVLSLLYAPETALPRENCIKLPKTDLITIDRRILLSDGTLNIKPNKCVVVSVSGSSLSPYWQDGDKMVLETSYTQFVDNQLFAFVYDGQCYLRKINILPKEIKCVSINDDRDTFVLSADMYNGIKILGLIIPNIRF